MVCNYYEFFIQITSEVFRTFYLFIISIMNFLFLFLYLYSTYRKSQSLESNILTISVDENTHVGKKITNLRNELKMNDSQITFLPFSSVYFRLTKHGDVFVQHALDRDNDTNLCSDNGNLDVCSLTNVIWLSNSNIISLRIVINDLNDNKPFWPIVPTVSIAENSPLNMEVDLPLAIDKDTNTNGIEKYELLNKNVAEFELKIQQSPNGIIPKLVIKSNLDRERVQNYNLTLAAIDGSRPYHTGTVIMYVEIADQNDNNPVFEKSTYRISIFENYPISTYLPIQPNASDADSGKFGEIAYHFSIATPEDVKNTFSIEKNTGKILVEKNIDYDTGKYLFEFIVVAIDGGSPALSATAIILIEIKDVNDQAPNIIINILPSADDDSISILEISENEPPNKLVTTITVSDTDTGDGGKFNCSLSLTNSFSMNFYKSLDQISIYQLISVRTFDREVESNIHTQILCQDKGNPVKSSKKLITVNISDINDNQPRFSQKLYKYQMKEENVPNSRIGEVFVTDQDAGKNSQIEYVIESAELLKQFFRIDQRGYIFATTQLDRELNPEGFKFKIWANDCGIPMLNDSTEVEIELIDINDCVPKFNFTEYTWPVTENDNIKPNIPLTIGVVEASDCDIGNNAKKTFKIGEPSTLFQISEKGYVELIGIIDHEFKSFYSFTILVIDSTQSDEKRNTGTATINIKVTDLNDNHPIFVDSINSSISIPVSYGEEVGYEIFNVYAKDADSALNGMVTYKIKSANYNNDLFAINEKSGSITIAKRLSPNNQGEIALIIVASDNGSPSLSSELKLIVVIDDSLPINHKQNTNRFFMYNNKIIIIIVVISTILVCAILISFICLMVNCKLSPQQNGIRMAYDEDGLKSFTSYPNQSQFQYNINNGKFSDANDSLLNLSSNFYFHSNQPYSNNCRSLQSAGYQIDSYNNAMNIYQKVNSNDTLTIDSEMGINRHADRSGAVVSVDDHRKMQSINYRQSPQPVSPQKEIDIDSNHISNHYNNTSEQSIKNQESNNKTMNWTIRSGHFVPYNYDFMYDKVNSDTFG